MTLFIEQDEYIPVLAPSAGVRVLVHRQEQQPFPDEEGFDVGPGQKSSVSLRLVSNTDPIFQLLGFFICEKNGLFVNHNLWLSFSD